MSDIKYILAGSNDDGEHYTRFSCLAIVRYAVAAVVTVLTITVIALSIHAVLRSEDVGLSVNKGFIGADTLWSHTYAPPARSSKFLPVPGGNDRHPSSPNKVVAAPATAAAKLSRRRTLEPPLEDSEQTDFLGATEGLGASSLSRSLPKDCLLGCSAGSRDEPTQQVTFKKADQTNLRVILIANNPGGRTKIDCNGTRVSLFDMVFPYGQIGNVTLDNFTLPPQTTITLQKRLSSTDTSYIWNNYRLATRFSVRVQVTSRVTSYPLGKRGKTVQQNYTCQPVTVGLIDDEAIYASDHVHCIAPSSSG